MFASLMSFVLLSSNAYSYLDPQFEKHAVKTYNIEVPGKALRERCYLLQRFPGMENKINKDEDILCAMNLYASYGDHPKLKTFYGCPKVNSTSVAVEYYEVPAGMTEAQFQKTICPLTRSEKKKMKARVGYPDKEAKFKFAAPGVSVGSILGYSRLTQLFKSVDVPPSVLRTVDLDTVLDHALAGRYLGLQMGNSYLNQYWYDLIGHLVRAKHGNVTQLPDVYTKPPHGLGIVPASFYKDGKRRGVSANSTAYWSTRILSEDKRQVFGVLAENPGNEELYAEAFGLKQDKTRIDQFRNSSVFWPILKDPRPISQILGSTELAKAGQKMLGMQDSSDMLVMDFLLDQADRIGNIHYKRRQFFLTAQGKVDDISDKKYREILAKAPGTLTPAEVELLNAIKQTGASLKVMLLKDNDGGFDMNTAKKYHLIADVKKPSSAYDSWKNNADLFLNATMVVRHFSPLVYKGVVQLHNQVFGPPESQAAMETYFRNSVQFTAAEYTIFKNNLLSLYRALYNNCKKGNLHLDLDMKSYFSANPKPILTTTPGVCEGQF
ncbi:hypothetical protein EZJ49_08530 [Bdellovibrio bacteriovorus]|uniref:hypothetical protein n=1 Tax=Bdellovibrio bacteriovorus TaxID=959 RepID=UPI0021D3DF79|nr:hypothetical protein [Bdellovibrio bacteriovorus]UXR63120.1 hypothetical protein EZJ49_08530 [Bdellovibrio bacteriovorus]